jgi:hypothetical protein
LFHLILKDYKKSDVIDEKGIEKDYQLEDKIQKLIVGLEKVNL